ncbi:MAG: nucleotidyltransferase family protein [candidate division WOR-3 bacterium]|nr:MAG: nucleotidyltransferase family protein [candidate division WOR-3 bacterium]
MNANGFADSGPVDLLLCCLSARADSLQSQKVQQSTADDWHEVVDLAARASLAPLLFKRLKECDARARVPADAWEQLRLAYFRSAHTNASGYHRLRPVLRRLRNSGIPVIALKGAFLAESVYGDIALRPMCDFDLMVPRAQLTRTRLILLDMGFAPQEGEEVETRRSKHIPPLADSNLIVEIHWTIATPSGPVRADTAGLWNRARPSSVAGVDVLTLSPEDFLLHLCVHFGCQHGLGIPKAVCDISETIRRFRSEIDWSQVANRARQWHAPKYVGLTLHLAVGMLGTEVPNSILERLVPGGIDQRLFDAAKEAVLTGTSVREAAPFGDELRQARERIFLSRDEMAKRYPASRESRHLYPYYALRLRDAGRSFGSRIAKQSLALVRSRERGGISALVKWLRPARP